MKKYLVKYKSCWSDEFYVEGLMLLDEHSKEFFDSLTEEHFPLAHVVGWNQTIHYQELSDLLKCYTWTPISNSEYEVIQKLIGEQYSDFYYPVLEDDQYN